MKNTVNLDLLFKQQEVLKKKVVEAEKTLAGRNAGLRVFNDATKKQLARELSSGQTTGNPLMDEIVRWFGLDKNAIDKILAFNESLTKGKEILIAVPRRQCTKNVMFPTESCQNEYSTFVGYIYGIPSGRRIKMELDEKASFIAYSVILPLQKYVKWDFGRDDIETPTEGPLIVDGSMFCSLNPNKLLASIIGEVKAPSLRDMSLSGFSPVEATLEVIIDGKIPGDKNTSGYGETLMALRHGRELMKLPTPSEKIAGANI
jgi:hypothetical protein